ncbi:unnamed protein product [Caenorhabditis angaria]|uniref:C-type lectin domain-containing protein n=1 Tax=Caenorhabditis angaria TaxID=860376 RepID=A0A9P1N4T9_9PELO|nr:unnamed protein product [Caenorhabditis angaria]
MKISFVVLSLFVFFAETFGATTTEPYCDELTTTTTAKKTTAKKITGYECPSGWGLFSRQKGKWCIKVFQNTLSQPSAKLNCQNVGAKLSGIENTNERAYIIKQGLGIVRSMNLKEGTLWVGGIRKTACSGSNKSAAGCVPWVNNAFEWIDGFTTLKKMFTWIPNQPDYYKNSETCIQMVISDKTPGTGGAKSGQMNDISCSKSTSTIELNYVRGYVCGKQATPIYG